MENSEGKVLLFSEEDKSFRCFFARGCVPGSLKEETGVWSLASSGDFA